MKPPPISYLAPATLGEAIDALAADPDARVLAGGQSLVPLLAMRLAAPSLLVDLRRIEGLDAVAEDGDSVRIGAMATQWDTERSPVVAGRLPLLCAALGHVAHPAIRSRGTIGGSVAHADPAAEVPAVVLALDGRMEVQGPGGSRTVDAEEFFQWSFTTSLRPDEVLTGVTLPAPSQGWSFQEVARRRGDFALALVAVVLRVDGGVCSHARIAVGGATSTTARAREAEQLLVGSPLDGDPDSDTVAAAAACAAAELQLVSDVHGSARYREKLVRQLVGRAVVEAAGRA